MILEALMISTLFGNIVGCYRQLFPTKPQKYTAPTSPSSPNTNIQHDTIVDSDGVNPVFNVSFVNNNANGPSAQDTTESYFKKTKVYLSDVASTISQYCKDNKYHLAALTIASSYGYLYYKVHTIKTYISNPNTWSAWMQDVPFEQMLSIPQDKLTHDLIATIQARYTSPQNPTDFLTPLIEFSKDIEKEKQQLTNYHTYISWGAQFSLQKIIPFSDRLLGQLTERKQRVVYLNTLFQTWLMQYKLEQITK